MSSKFVQYHNEAVLQTLEPGDGVEFKRGHYSHWGLYIGGRQVIHLAGDENDGINGMSDSGTIFTICGRRFNKALVKKDDFFKVAGDSKAYKNNRKDRKLQVRSVDEMIATAMSMLGEIGYNVLWRNCEHFVSYCRHGEWKSDQVDTVGLMAAGGALVVGLLGIGVGLLTKNDRQRDRDVYLEN